MMNGILTREALLNIAHNPQTKTIEIPELGGSIVIRLAPASLSFEISQIRDKSDGSDTRAITLLTARSCIVDGEGQPLYTAETVEEFLLLPAIAAERIMTEINQFNGWGVKAREELEKNSESQDDALLSDSPSVLA